MPKSSAKSATQLPIHGSTKRARVLAALTLLAMLLLWSSNHSTITLFLDFWRYPTESFSEIHDNSLKSISFSSPHNVTQPHQISIKTHNSSLAANINSTDLRSHDDKKNILPRVSTHEDPNQVLVNPMPIVEWVSVELEQNYTSNLLSRCCLGRGDVPVKGPKTVDIKFLNIDDGKPIVLSTGNPHEVFFQAVDESGNSHTYGGDYFEIDLAGEWWRSRPPTKDIGNGTYSFILQVHPDFAGTYNLTIRLLYRNFGGLQFLSLRLVYDKQLRNIAMTFLESKVKLSELHLCKKSDFNRGLWAGRWTRHAKNDTCDISDDGRYRCLEPNHPCTIPWCNGSVGMLESNGWVYSAHCSFILFSAKDAWNCLNNRWLFFWGDSTNVDTIRNMLFFTLGVPLQDLEVIGRHFDETFTNPKDRSQSVRITQFWNAHWNVSENFMGLKTLAYKDYQDSLESFFNGSVVPDTILFNSGLHDGRYWRHLDKFAIGVDHAISVWREIIEGVKQRGLEIPNFIFRSTVATSSDVRFLGLNPSKIEAFNGIILEKVRASGLISGVIDYFDMTWAWHSNLRSSDGVHYGRFPSKRAWKDGQIGHHYFVDLMLGQVILNAICPM